MISKQLPSPNFLDEKVTSVYGESGLDDLFQESCRRGLRWLWDDFQFKISDLFILDESEIRVRIASHIQPLRWISTPGELRSVAEEESSLVVINRFNSWSELDVTLELFSAVCSFSRITPPFLHFVVGMGRKFGSQDEDFMSCYSTYGLGSDSTIYDENDATAKDNDYSWSICYNIRYVERNNRNMEDPWSCRQSAIHQSLREKPRHSAYVVIQPPELFSPTASSNSHPMLLHLRYLSAAVANWREYLDSFSQKFKALPLHCITKDQQISIPNPYQKFSIGFSHEQHLHKLRTKLQSARSILVSMKDTFEFISNHESAIARNGGISPAASSDFQGELANITREVKSHIETSKKLLCVSDDLKSMYNNILAFRAQELQHETSLKLARLAQADAAGSSDMALLADLTYKDSRAMRIATAIAMFYLPVNLVMSFFSSTLVWFGTTGDIDESGSPTMQIRSEVWIASVAAMVLAVGTVGWFWWWNRREQWKSTKGTVPTGTSI